IPYPQLPARFVDETGPERARANAFDHRGEGVPGKPFDQLRAARINVDRPRRHGDPLKARLEEKRIQSAPDQRVSPRPRLKLDQALDDLSRVGAVGVEMGRAVITLDHGHGAARPQDLPEALKGLERS